MYSPRIYKIIKDQLKKCITISTFDFIPPYNKYMYMNNSLISCGPRLCNELYIDNKN